MLHFAQSLHNILVCLYYKLLCLNDSELGATEVKAPQRVHAMHGKKSVYSVL